MAAATSKAAPANFTFVPIHQLSDAMLAAGDAYVDSLSAYRASSSPPSSPSSLGTPDTGTMLSPFEPERKNASMTLAELQPDSLLIIAKKISSVLAPRHLVALAQTCKGVRGALFPELLALLRQHQSATSILASCGISCFAQLATTTVLDLSSRGLTDDECDVLAQLIASGALASLQELHLDDNHFGPAGARAIGRAIGRAPLPSLRVLDLCDNPIGDVGICALARAIGRGSLPSLRALHLYGTQMRGRGLAALAASLSEAPQLEELIMSNNPIGDKGISALAEASRGAALASLRHANLNGCDCGDAGAASLADAMADGALPELRHLFLHDNQIGDGGLTALSAAAAAGALASIRELALDNNRITDAGVVALEEACGEGALSGLQELRLQGNHVGDHRMMSLTAALRKVAQP